MLILLDYPSGSYLQMPREWDGQGMVGPIFTPGHRMGRTDVAWICALFCIYGALPLQKKRALVAESLCGLDESDRQRPWRLKLEESRENSIFRSRAGSKIPDTLGAILQRTYAQLCYIKMPKFFKRRKLHWLANRQCCTSIDNEGFPLLRRSPPVARCLVLKCTANFRSDNNLLTSSLGITKPLM